LVGRRLASGRGRWPAVGRVGGGDCRQRGKRPAGRGGGGRPAGRRGRPAGMSGGGGGAATGENWGASETSFWSRIELHSHPLKP
jgi:hypothetical protein